MKKLTRPKLTALTAGAAALAFLFAWGNARAGGLPLKSGDFSGKTITTVDQTVAGAVTTFLYLENVDQLATICIAFSVPATIAGTTCAAGEITLQPGAFRFFDVTIPTDAVHAIASASAGLTVGVQ